MATTTIPGVPGGPIQTSFPVKLLIAPAWRTNVRPGIKARTPRLPVQHETANPNTYAIGDATYLYNGSGGRQASWHMTVDDKEAIIGIPLDEVTWQASDGAGPGNYNGISCELAVHSAIVNNSARRAQSQKNAAEIMGTIGARLNATPPAKRHHDYAPDKKWCPAQMMNRGEWNRYVDWWQQFYSAEKARMSGTTLPTPAGFKKGDRIKVVADAVNVRAGYSTSHRVLTTIMKGQEAVIIGDDVGTWTTQSDGYTWIDIQIIGGTTGWVATGIAGEPWFEKVAAAPPPAPKPKTYAPKSPVPELLETNLGIEDIYNTAVAVSTVNEKDFIFVADVVEFKRESKAQQYAGSGGEEVGPPYQEGDRVVAAWITQIDNGTYWYLLTGSDDEWVRVAVADTVRIADAPLLPSDGDLD